MKALPLISGLVLCAAALPAARPVQATGILRCESASGGVIYTDRACEAHGARAVPMPGELLARIASDRDAEAFPDAALQPAAGPGATVPGRRSPAAGCARSPSQLARDLQGSLALRDVNRLAESYHWVGHTHRQAQPVLGRLDRMNRRPLQDVAFFDVRIGAAALDASAAPASRADGMAGLMQLSFGEGGGYEVVDFEVRRYAGCYFVRFRDSGYRA